MMTIVGRVLFGADQAVGDFVRARVPWMQERGFGPFVGLGIIQHDRLVAGIVFHNYRGHDMDMAVAADGLTMMTPAMLRTIYAYPFHQVGVLRLTAITARANKRTRKLIEATGFKLEGVHRKAMDGRQDAMSYGLLRDECRWLKPRSEMLKREAKNG